ncbi:MAG: DUF4900 domain-containing protein, partial [Terriglobia bacterium]
MGTVWRTRKRGEIEVRQRGSATAMVLAISTVLTVLSASALYLAESNATMTNHRNRRARALDVAEAGVNNYLWHLNHDENYYLTAVHPAQGQDSSGRDRWVDFEGGQYHLEIDPPDEGDSVIAVEATGKVETLKSKRTIRVEIRKKSFLSYLYFTDAERGESGSEIWWTSGDVVHGPLHTNGDMRITGRPAFEDMVTMAGHINKGRNYSPNFQRGHQEGTQPLQLPPGNSQLKAEAQNRGYYYYGQTTISLNSNGSLRVANANNRSTGPTGTVWPPSNGLVYVDGQTRAANPRHATNGNLYVSGTLSGRLTLAAKNNIYITDNVLNRDQTDDSSDMLGLAADNFV